MHICFKDENASWVNQEGKGKEIYYYSSKWVMLTVQALYISYGVSPFYRPLHCQNVALTYIKLIIQYNFPVFSYRMGFWLVIFHSGVKDLKIQALFSFKKGLSRTLTVPKYQHSKVIKKNQLFPFMTEQEILG